jgi:HSP20 family molecular chaperone IbpA
VRPDERAVNERRRGRGRNVIREAPLGETPERPPIPSGRPSQGLTLTERLRQERTIRLDPYQAVEGITGVAITADLSGGEPSEASLSVDPGVITISRELRQDRAGREHSPLWWTCRESRRQSTSETLELPPGLDVYHWTATFDAGVLCVTIPRRP